MKLRGLSSGSLLLAVVLFGCDAMSPGADNVSDQNAVAVRSAADQAQVALANQAAASLFGLDGSAKALDRPPLWADDAVYVSVVTPSSFKPSAGNFDELYLGGNGFKDGIPLISDAKPGDKDFNGGRWHANVLREDVDPGKYSNASSDADLDPDDFVSTDMYFECPVIPRRGHSAN